MNYEQRIDTDVLADIQSFINHGQDNKNIEYLASGKYGDVFTYQDDIAFKVFKEEAKYTDDPVILGQLQGIEGYPTLYAGDPGKYMVMERINGQTIYDIEGKTNLLLSDYKPELKRMIEQAEERGWGAEDVHLNNIMLDETGKLHLIDVGMFQQASEQPELMKLGWMSRMFSTRSSYNHRHRHGYRHGHRRSSSDYHRRGYGHHRRSSYSFSFNSSSS